MTRGSVGEFVASERKMMKTPIAMIATQVPSHSIAVDARRISFATILSCVEEVGS